MQEEISQKIQKVQKAIENSSPLGRASLRETGINMTEMFELVEIIDEILVINEVFSELGEDEYFLYLMLMQYAQKKLIGKHEEDSGKPSMRLKGVGRSKRYRLRSRESSPPRD